MRKRKEKSLIKICQNKFNVDENDWHLHAVATKNTYAFNSPVYWINKV